MTVRLADDISFQVIIIRPQIMALPTGMEDTTRSKSISVWRDRWKETKVDQRALSKQRFAS
jgi:hypothetical protein